MKYMSMMAIALLASSAAVAQPMGGHGGGMMQMMGGGGGHHCMMMQRTEGALAFLKTELKITGSQEAAWNAFAASYRAAAPAQHGGDHKKHQGPRNGKAQSFIEKAAHHQDMMETHHQTFAKRYEAARALYDALDAGQRKTADELLMHYVMPHHGGMHE